MIPSKQLYPSHVSVSAPRDQLIADAKACGSPKGFRLYLQEYDNALAAEYRQKYAKLAAGCAATAASFGLAPALFAVVKNCPQVASAEAQAICATNAGSAVGAVFGLIGVSLAGFALHLGRLNLLEFVRDKDSELKDRFGPLFERDTRCTTSLMTRYALLSTSDREEVKNQLFQAYLANPRPARAEPPRSEMPRKRIEQTSF